MKGYPFFLVYRPEATGVVVLAVAFGGSFAIAFAFAFGRLGTLHARGTALVVALLGFVAVYGVPFLKYPPNPPAIGDPSTIQIRTALYFAVIAIALLAKMTQTKR